MGKKVIALFIIMLTCNIASASQTASPSVVPGKNANEKQSKKNNGKISQSTIKNLDDSISRMSSVSAEIGVRLKNINNMLVEIDKGAYSETDRLCATMESLRRDYEDYKSGKVSGEIHTHLRSKEAFENAMSILEKKIIKGGFCK